MDIIKLEKLHGTQGAEANGSFFASFCRGSSRKPTPCNHLYIYIFFFISSILWIADSHIENSTVAMTSLLVDYFLVYNFRAIGIQDMHIKGNVISFQEICARSAESPRKA